MKIHRSTKLSLKFCTDNKRATLQHIMDEYSKAVNFWIDRFWNNTPEKKDLLKGLLDEIDPFTKLSYRMKSESAREAVSIVNIAKITAKSLNHKLVKPKHHGNKMSLSSKTVILKEKDNATEFDKWLHIYSIGLGLKPFDIPIRLHKHFNELAAAGTLSTSMTINKNDIIVSVEIETGPKFPTTDTIGIDTGINHLATINTGEHYGSDIKELLARIKRCKHGSCGQKRARRALKQRIDEVAKQVVTRSDATVIVVENLKGITKNTKNRMGKTMRHVIGSWNYRYWLTRVEQNCERNRVSFRTVFPYNTSRICSNCGYSDKRNRNRESFSCLECGHTEHADTNAAKNILHRFLTGPYGAGCKAKCL